MLKLTSLLATFAALAVAGALAISSSLASSDAIFVDRLDDPAVDGCSTNGCSLREAVALANGGSGQQVVEVPAGTITLQSGTISISGNVAVSGEGAGSTIINGNGGRSFTVSGTGFLDHLTVRGAAGSPGCGGAILNSGDLTLSHVELSSNDITGQGAGLCNTGSATIADSDISGNAASNNDAGAGIHNSGTMTITASTFENNTARGVSGGGDGAAIVNAGGATLTLEGSLVSGNTGTSTLCDDCSSGAIANDGTITISHSTIDSNFGDKSAALDNEGTATIEKSTVSRNTYGSILNASQSLLTIVNSTISGNLAGPYPKSGLGGIYNNGTVSIISSTIANNTSTQFQYGGLYNSNQSNQTSFRSSIMANNGQINCWQGGTIVSNGSNVVDDDSCRLNSGSDQVVADAGIEALADNGGATETHGLEPDSSAIDSGQGQGCAVDQRDATRNPVECDSGSFERGATPPTPTAEPTATPVPAAYPMGDFNCNDRIDGGDITDGLRLAAGLDAPDDCGRDTIPCFEFEGQCFSWWTDPDCNEAVTPGDALRVVLYLGDSSPQDACTVVGEMPPG